jgi:hypothetical protein
MRLSADYQYAASRQHVFKPLNFVLLADRTFFKP